jgi:hypothetical protein
MDCGLVLDRIIGADGGGPEGGGGRVRKRSREEEEEEEDLPFLQQQQESPSPYRRRRFLLDRERGRELITSVLAVFHLDNQHVMERAIENYDKIYGSRRARRGFRKSEFKQRVACAFSICNSLARLQMPRPPEYVARLCEVPCRPLLNVRAQLNLSEEELGALRPEDYELEEARPQDYIDVVCSNLRIPFNTAGEVRRVAEEAQWVLHGRQPTVIAAASIQFVLAERGELGVTASGADICNLFDCQQRTVDKALNALRRGDGP